MRYTVNKGLCVFFFPFATPLPINSATRLLASVINFQSVYWSSTPLRNIPLGFPFRQA